MAWCRRHSIYRVYRVYRSDDHQFTTIEILSSLIFFIVSASLLRLCIWLTNIYTQFKQYLTMRHFRFHLRILFKTQFKNVSKLSTAFQSYQSHLTNLRKKRSWERDSERVRRCEKDRRKWRGGGRERSGGINSETQIISRYQTFCFDLAHFRHIFAALSLAIRCNFQCHPTFFRIKKK